MIVAILLAASLEMMRSFDFARIGAKYFAAPGSAKTHLQKCMASSAAQTPGKEDTKSKSTDQKVEGKEEKKKTLAQQDDEMRQAMEGLSGDGGEAGAELEDGKPVAMKRSVKENMFRYI